MKNDTLRILEELFYKRQRELLPNDPEWAELERGYMDMARLELTLAEEALPLDEQALAAYEQSLRSVNGHDKTGRDILRRP